MRRRLVFLSASLLTAVVVLAATLPWWLSLALPVAGRRVGLVFKEYQRIGYARFALRDAKVAVSKVTVTADRIETDTPVLWLWRQATGTSSPVLLGNWVVDVAPPPKPPNVAPAPAPGAASGWIPLRGTLRRVASVLDRWLPSANSQSGTVRWSGGELRVAGANWSARTLTVRQLEFRALAVDGSLSIPSDADELRLGLQATDRSYGVQLASRGTRVNGNAELWDQPFLLDAQFGTNGWMPQEASLGAEEWRIPGEKLKLGGTYRHVRGTTKLEWREDRFAVELTAQGEPEPSRGQVPPLDISVRARGDFNAVTVDALNVILPGITARLSEPVTVAKEGGFRPNGAQFVFEADLAKQPWFPATGTLNGEARFASGSAVDPLIDFQFHAKEISTRGIDIAAADARGHWHWPQIMVDAGSLVGGEGERVEWHGGWDFRARSVLDAAVSGQIRRRSLARWLPAKPEFDVVSLRGSASGALDTLSHEGEISARQISFPPIKPVDATFTWRGAGMLLSAFQLQAAAARTRVSAAGAANRTSVRLDQFALVQDEVQHLSLTQPAQFRWDRGFDVENLHLSGPAGGIDATVSWGEAGRMEVAARNISSDWFRDLIAPSDLAWDLKLFALSGAWERGPMNFSASAGGEVTLGKGHRVAVITALRGGAKGLVVEALRATESDLTVLNASGEIPVAIRPFGRPLFEFDPEGKIKFTAAAAPHAQFWAQLAAVSGIELQEPDGNLSLSGTWSRPEGEINLKAAKVLVDPARFKRPVPLLEGLELRVTGNRTGLRLDHLKVKVEGQSVRAEGNFAIPDGGWEALRKSPLAVAKAGSDFQLELASTELAAFSRFLPGFVAPTGRLELNMSYRHGEFGGFVRLREAASRPLGPLGVLQEVNADAELHGRRFVLREVTAKSGGQPVKLAGVIEVPENGSPRYDLTLRGENLPFARQAGLLLRGDLDLALKSPPRGEPKLTGAVRLRDSLFLADVRSFVPTGAQTAARRPPYFAISTPPINAWLIDVEVTGRQFLKVRTPVFTGVASANFRLRGTLGEPRAIGDVKLDEGHVIMPFANFELQQGVVRLTESNPYEPAIFIRGAGRRFGYNLTLEVDGPASAPNVVLSSSPALDSEQVLLMVMTGAPPSDEINFSATQRVTRIGTFLGQTLLGSLGGDTANADRLSISSGDKISRQGKETYEIEYKLSDRLTLVGEYNEFDEQNAGLKWRIFPRRRAAQEGSGETK